MYTSEVAALETGVVVQNKNRDRFFVLARAVSSRTADVTGIIVVPLLSLFGGHAFVKMSPKTLDVHNEWWSDVKLYGSADAMVVLDVFQ